MEVLVLKMACLASFPIFILHQVGMTPSKGTFLAVNGTHIEAQSHRTLEGHLLQPWLHTSSTEEPSNRPPLGSSSRVFNLMVLD